MPNNGTPGKPKRFSDYWAWTLEFFRKIANTTSGIAVRLRGYMKVWVRGEHSESEKTVLQTGWKAALAHCGVHVLPLFAIIVLSYLNFAGFFIGAKLQGHTDETAQAISRLCLQVTAKLLELLVIASLSTIIMDIVRSQMISEEGIPLGLLTARFRFTDIGYLISHEFRAGSTGFDGCLKRWCFVLIIVSASLIAVLAGPSTALLLIPTWQETWPAGSARFWVDGDLYPPTVDRLATWDSLCLDPLKFIRNSGSEEVMPASCIWAGYPYLAEAFRQKAKSKEPIVSYSDGTFRRDISLSWGHSPPGIIRGEYLESVPASWLDSVRVAAYASNLALGAFSQKIGQNEWCTALFQAPETQPGKRLANLRWREGNSTKGNIRSQVSVVRTQCFDARNYMPDYIDQNLDTSDHVLLPFPIIPNFEGRRDLRYYIPVKYLNTSAVATQWIAAPIGASNTSYGEELDHYPSAFLVIQNYSFGLVKATITCSVQADWAPGTNVADEICWQDQNSITQRAVLDDIPLMETWSMKSQFKPEKPTFNQAKGWQSIKTTKAWLDELTPTLEMNATGQTTMASVIQQANSLSQDKNDRFFTLTSIVASFVADGLSRTGYDETYASEIIEDKECDSDNASGYCNWAWKGSTWLEVFSSIFNNKAELSPPQEHRQQSGQMYVWYATVAGLGLKTTSTAYYLAFAVLYVYLILVSLHIMYILRKEYVSSSWSSVTDLIALSQTSPAPENLLEHTCSGVRSHKTMRLKMRVRVNTLAPVGGERLHLVFSQDGSTVNSALVKRNEKY